jgi:hypothetical protein
MDHPLRVELPIMKKEFKLPRSCLLAYGYRLIAIPTTIWAK